MPGSSTPSPRSCVTSRLSMLVSCGCGSGQDVSCRGADPSSGTMTRFGGSLRLSAPSHEAQHLREGVGRALEQPTLLHAGQVKAVEERPVAFWRRAIAAQVDGRVV